jgi:hypothetical protein
MPLFNNGRKVETGVLTFRGFTLLMNLQEEAPRLKDAVIAGEHLDNAGLSYHVKRFDFKVGKYPSQQLFIKW